MAEQNLSMLPRIKAFATDPLEAGRAQSRHPANTARRRRSAGRRRWLGRRILTACGRCRRSAREPEARTPVPVHRAPGGPGTDPRSVDRHQPGVGELCHQCQQVTFEAFARGVVEGFEHLLQRLVLVDQVPDARAHRVEAEATFVGEVEQHHFAAHTSGVGLARCASVMSMVMELFQINGRLCAKILRRWRSLAHRNTIFCNVRG